MTDLAQGNSVTLSLGIGESVMINSGRVGSAKLESTSVLPGAANKQFLMTHPGGRATYGPFGTAAGTAKLSAIGDAIVYLQGVAPLDDRGLYFGQAATACRTPVLFFATSKQFESRSRHILRSAVNGTLQVAYQNWYQSLAWVETGTGAAATFSGSVEYLGVCYEFTWSAVNSVSVANGATSVLCDAVAGLNAPEGAEIFIHTRYENTAGIIYNAQSASTDSGDTANGEKFVHAVSGLADQHNTPGVPIGGTTGTNLSFTPCVIGAQITKPSVLIIGDSNDDGIWDVYSGTSGDRGTLPRSIGPHFGYMKYAQGGDGADKWVAVNAKRVAVATLGGFTHVVCKLGINDLRLRTRTPAQLLADMKTVRALFPGLAFFACTLMPVSTSTNGFIDVLNQTPDADDADILAYNDLLRAGVAEFTGYFDVYDAIASSRASALWAPNPSANLWVHNDAGNLGLHTTGPGNIVIQNSGVINPARITR